MAQYDVYPSPDGRGYLLSLQSDLLQVAETTVVAPLLPAGSAPSAVAKRLNPRFRILGAEAILFPQAMAAVPNGVLATPVANLASEAFTVTSAIDMVFQGF